ncbi:DNA cytosine methyltransferase [Brucella intermedia]|uniref:DNA cytosine methyltransferase n=1 Tax=Brucella intermedia TaxID=94625 RepID=UPI000EFA37C4|nr:DNA (cytosine-5-)-methyltransferase [Brucella intermedia]KAB2720391.1 DNA (cytosine-5-)-methyltransferase [Brucella intermedia]
MSVTRKRGILRVVDLFCGAGGLSLGLKNSGLDVVQAYDAWQPAIDTYRANVGHHAWKHDLKDILGVGSMIAQLQPDMIVGGPPCQDYSIAGERQEGQNAVMTKAFAMMVAIARPRWFLMENVEQAKNSKAWAEARAILVRAGYGLTECKLDASYYGVAQARRRLFVVGRLGERDGFLTSALIAARSERQMTLGDLFGADCPPLYIAPRFTRNKAVWHIDGPAPTLIASSWRPIPKSRQVPEGTAVPTLSQMGQIQGFPADWKWQGSSKHESMKLIANAVPVQLAEAIGKVILARVAGESVPAIQGNFGQWLMQRGQTSQVARNTKSHLTKAWRLLGGRTFRDVRLEVLALEETAEFDVLDRKVKSNLRAAVRLYAEFLNCSARRVTPIPDALVSDLSHSRTSIWSGFISPALPSRRL